MDDYRRCPDQMAMELGQAANREDRVDGWVVDNTMAGWMGERFPLSATRLPFRVCGHYFPTTSSICPDSLHLFMLVFPIPLSG